MEALKVLASEVPEKARLLADRFWPGPLTMIMPKSGAVPYATTGGLDTVAIRMPSHPTAYELIRSSGVYIAAPSANTSGRPSPTTAQHVYEDLNGRIDMIIDSGKVDIGLESTIVDLTGEIPTILRPGYITKEMLEEAVGPVTIDKAILADHEDPNLRPKAPGMKYKQQLLLLMRIYLFMMRTARSISGPENMRKALRLICMKSFVKWMRWGFRRCIRRVLPAVDLARPL